MNRGNELVIEPSDFIVFSYFENTAVTSMINLKNISGSNVAFKLRTTAPNSYFVRPSMGVVGPNETMTVNIVLQPLRDYPRVMRDKFLVRFSQTLLRCDSLNTEVGKFWDNMSADSGKSMKLQVKIVKGIGNQDKSDGNHNRNESEMKNIHENVEIGNENNLDSLDLDSLIKILILVALGIYAFLRFYQF